MTVPRKTLLNLFLGSVAVNAALGIWALLAPEFGEVQGKVLATSLCVSAAMLSVLVNAGPMARRVVWPFPVLAASTGAASFMFLAFVLWAEPDGDAWWKLVLTGFTVAAAGTLVGLMALLRLRRSTELVRLAHTASTVVLALTTVVVIWAEIDEDWMGRVIGVESIVVASLTLTVPALARFQRAQTHSSDPAQPVRPAHGDRVIVCPECGAEIDLAAHGGAVSDVGAASHDAR